MRSGCVYRSLPVYALLTLFASRPDQAAATVRACQQAVHASDKALIALRNSGVDEGSSERVSPVAAAHLRTLQRSW